MVFFLLGSQVQKKTAKEKKKEKKCVSTFGFSPLFPELAVVSV